MKILIADDDRVFVSMLSNYLRKHGFELIPVYDGVQTMMFARRTNPDVILLDISMPASRGFDVLQKLKGSSVTGHIPIIVVSGSVDAAADEKVVSEGADAFMRKPVDPDKLYEVICHVLGIQGRSSTKESG